MAQCGSLLPYMPKYLFTFQKTETVRWLGHLDILRTFERAIRRAGLPIAFTSGFNPRERLTFASALSTGVTGAAEPAIIELTDPVRPSEIEQKLNAALPPAIHVANCEEIPDAGSRDLLNAFDRAEYEVVCACAPGLDASAMSAAIERLLALSEISIVREREGRSKSVDIRSLIDDLTLCPERPEPDRIALRMRLAVGERGNAKPAEVIAALQKFLPDLVLRRAHRIKLSREAPRESLMNTVREDVSASLTSTT